MKPRNQARLHLAAAAVSASIAASTPSFAAAVDSSPRPATEAFIGVHVAKPTPPVAAQLGLGDGIGIVVGLVQSGSPAQIHGLQQYDILLKLDDQLLVNPEQFATLVTRYRPGAAVTLSILRAAKEQSLPVTLGERPASPKPPLLPPSYSALDNNRPAPSPDTTLQAIRNSLGANYSADLARRIHSKLQNSQSEEGSSSVSSPAFPTSITTTSDTTTITTIGGNTLFLTGTGDARRLRATSRDGTPLFEGPYDTPENMAKVPEDLQNTLHLLKTLGTRF